MEISMDWIINNISLVVSVASLIISIIALFTVKSIKSNENNQVMKNSDGSSQINSIKVTK